MLPTLAVAGVVAHGFYAQRLNVEILFDSTRFFPAATNTAVTGRPCTVNTQSLLQEKRLNAFSCALGIVVKNTVLIFQKGNHMGNDCQYATVLKRRWVGDAASCHVVECRSPEALCNLKSFKDEKGIEYLGVRKPCNEDFSLIPDANYLHVRSRFCNRKYCPYYSKGSQE